MKQRQFPNQISTLRTSRLILRELSVNDIEPYFDLCSRPETMRPYGLAYHKCEDETREVIKFLDEEFQKKACIRWGIVYKENGCLIGDIGFWRFDWIRNRGEVGAKLSPAYLQKGIMTEASSAVIDYGFKSLKLHSIESGVNPNNKASKKLAEKLGFRQEGYRREFSYSMYEQKYLDSYLYTLLERDWQPEL